MKKLLPNILDLVKSSSIGKRFISEASKGSTLIQKKSKGFTLIELMVVISIIAILSVIGLAVFSNVQRESRNSKRRADVNDISKALESHYNTTINQHCTGNAGSYCAPAGAWFSNGAVPTDPQNEAAYTGQPIDGATTYNVCATLEGGGTFCKTQQQ